MKGPNRPWGVASITSMISYGVSTQLPSGQWVRAVPIPYHKTMGETVRAAWWVFTGKAEAVVWPKAGDLERALNPTPAPKVIGTTYDGVKVLAPAVPSKNFTQEEVRDAIAKAKSGPTPAPRAAE